MFNGVDLNPAPLRSLQEIARLGSFSRAAAALHLSQPAVSHQIRGLEARLGVPLLERVGKRAALTRAGELLLEHARRALAELETAATAVRHLAGVVSGRVRIGTGATASIYLLPPILRRLRSRYREIEIIVVTGNSNDITAGVAANELDMGLVTLPVHGRSLTVSPFCVDPLVAIAPPDRRWPRGGVLTAADLAQHPLILYERGGTIRRVIDEWLRRGGVVPRVAMELGSSEAIKKLVEAGLGLSITPAITVRDEVRRGSLRALRLSPLLHRRLGIVRRRDKPANPALDAVLGALKASKKVPAG
jgi:DNA-binding transcriptional LysR family regulator